MPVCLDHIVVTAPELNAGVRAVEAELGVSLTPGGNHPRMGTHNCLLRLSEATYLEVIAADPEAPQPAWPRWFGLDRLAADAAPALAGWVARCSDIRAAQAVCADTVGRIQPMTRAQLAWQITLRADGALPLGGAGPTLIEWETAIHPAAALPDVGCRLAQLAVYHPDPERVYGLFTALDLQARPSVYWSGEAPPYLVATLDTPMGRRTLQGAVPLPAT